MAMFLEDINSCSSLEELMLAAEKNKKDLISFFNESDYMGTAYELWSATKDSRDHNGQFFTPSVVKEEGFALLPKNINWKVCDIAGAGTGRLLESEIINIVDAFGIESDPSLVKLALHKGINVSRGNGFEVDRNKFPFKPNLYVFNPAYRWTSSQTSSRHGGNAAARTSINVLEFTENGDYIVAILPLNALTGERETGFDSVREYMLQHVKILGIIEYHYSVFLNTKIRSCVIVGKVIGKRTQMPQYTFSITKHTTNKTVEVTIANTDVIENRLNYDTYATAIVPPVNPSISFDEVVKQTSIDYKTVSKNKPCISLHNCERENECKTIIEVNSPFTLSQVEEYITNSRHVSSVYARFTNPGIKYDNVPLKHIRKYVRFPENPNMLNRPSNTKYEDASGHATLYWDDALVALDRVKPASINLAIIDPPYNIGATGTTTFRPGEYEQKTVSKDWDTFEDTEFNLFNESWIEKVLASLDQNTGSAFVYGTHHNIYKIGHLLQQKGARIINSIVWFKPNSPPNVSCRTLRDSVEHIIWFAPASSKWVFNYDYAKGIAGKQLRNVWEFPKVAPREKNHGGHPTQKPEALTERLILIASNPGDLILSPFAGSGTEMKVALGLDRRTIGIEKEEEYICLINRRLGQIFF